MLPSCSPGAQDIQRAAADLFARRDYGSVSISAIATAAGSSKANIYHHFGSKQGLYFAVMRDATQRSVLRLRAIAQEEDPQQRVELAIREHLRMLGEDPQRARLMMREVMFSSPRSGQELAHEVFGEHFTAIAGLLGSIHGAPAAEAGFLAFMLLSANVMRFHCLNVLRHMPGAVFADDEDVYCNALTTMLMREERTPPDVPGAVS